MTAQTLGADTSHWNTQTPDYHAMKAAGYEFIIMKATDGKDGVDPTFHDRIDAAHDAGLLTGAYHFARCQQDVDANLANFRKTITGHHVDLPYFLDQEEVIKGQSDAHVFNWSKHFLAGAAKPKQPCRVYGFSSWFGGGPHLEKLGTGCWIARPVLEPATSYELWQRGTRVIPGIGRADLNIFPGNLQTFLHVMGLTPLPPPGGTGYSKVTRSDVWRSFGKPRDSKCANGYVFSHARHLSWEHDVAPLNPGLNVKSLHLGHYVRTR